MCISFVHFHPHGDACRNYHFFLASHSLDCCFVFGCEKSNNKSLHMCDHNKRKTYSCIHESEMKLHNDIMLLLILHIGEMNVLLITRLWLEMTSWPNPNSQEMRVKCFSCSRDNHIRLVVILVYHNKPDVILSTDGILIAAFIEKKKSHELHASICTA